METKSSGRSREQQYKWLSESVDPAPSFEREFLNYLYNNGHRLPDFAQYQPTPEVHVQADFYYERQSVPYYYERQSVPGVCVFIDGPHHDSAAQGAHDQEVRMGLTNLGFRVIAIRHDRSIAEQIAADPLVFSQ